MSCPIGARCAYKEPSSYLLAGQELGIGAGNIAWRAHPAP